MSTAIDVVEQMIRAIEAGDLDGVRLCYSPDIVVWANFDGRARDLDGALRVLAWMLGNTSERRYEIRRRIEIEGGVLQQHVLHGTAASTGRKFSMPACLVVSVRGGRINHIDEYLDPSVLQPAFAE